MNNIYAKLHLTIILLFASDLIFGQTCIVLVKRKSDMFIAADSRQVDNARLFRNGKSYDTTIRTTVCKINRFKNIYFSIAGDADSSVTQIAQDACTSKNIQEAALKFRIAAMNHFQTTLNDIWKINPSFYKKEYPTKGVCHAIFYGLENRRPYWVEMIFYLRDLPPQEPIIDTSVSENPPLNYLNYRITVLGRRSEIEKIDSDHMNSFMAHEDLSESLDFLIKQQIKKDSTEVSEPIDILQITNQGEIWKRRKQICH